MYLFIINFLLLTLQGINSAHATLFNNTADRFDLALFYITDDPSLLAELNIQVLHKLQI